MSKKILILASIILISAIAHLIYKINFENMPFAEFQQNVKKDTAIKIIIYGTNGNKKFTEELSLPIEN
ncbi:hypothetical protein HCB26_15645 [Listeria booriae]|uniref:Uncharacterized protein n=1 Tax=Listeria booriae TaxID=1552123 RepID=A0A7X0Z2E8_9LIST|nr:hypothetical protein [Listeria booriae]MBC2168011.1 hypothetical protein [Listeria booriae]